MTTSANDLIKQLKIREYTPEEKRVYGIKKRIERARGDLSLLTKEILSLAQQEEKVKDASIKVIINEQVESLKEAYLSKQKEIKELTLSLVNSKTKESDEAKAKTGSKYKVNNDSLQMLLNQASK